MPEPIGVAFVEVLPDLATFRAATQAEIAKSVGAAKFTVPPPAGAAAATTQIRALGTAADQAASAETLLAEAQAKAEVAASAGAAVTGRAAKAHLQRAAAAEADAAAQRALFAITEETDAAIVAEIDALVTATGSLNAKAAAEERAAFATRTHSVASREASEAVLAETATMTGLRGASLGVNPAFLLATAAAIGFFKSAEEAGKFEESMHAIEFATHASGEELKRTQRIAEGFGRSADIFQASAVDAAEAIAEEVKSGQSLNEAVAETPAILNLATAAELSHADAVRTTVQLLDAYNLTADRATDVTDAITIAGKEAAGTNEDFAQSLRVAAPVANAFGLSIRDTVTLLIQMVQGGVSASQAGSLLRQSLLRLTNPTDKVRAALKSIGIDDFRKEFLKANGDLRPDAFERLALALQGVDKQQQRNILTLIFSRRAVTGLLTLTGDQRSSYEEVSRAAHEYGIAQEEARSKSEGLHGQTKELKADLSDLGVEVGKLTVGPLTLFVKTLRLEIGTLADFVSGLEVAGTAVGHFASSLEKKIPGGGLLGDAFGFAKKVVPQAAKLVTLGPTITGVSLAVDHFGGSADDASPKVDKLDASVARLGSDAAQAGRDIEDATGKVRTLGLAGQLAIAEATGTQADQLGILREQQARQRAALARKRRLFAEGKINEAAVIAQANQLDQTNAAIASILSEQKSKAEAAAADAKDKASKIAAAQQERDDALVSALSSEQARREAKVQAASSTEALADDIRANIALRNFFRRAIEEVQKRIQQVRAEGRATRQLRDELQTLRLAKAEVRREIEALRREAKQQRAETRVESAQLDVELASITSATDEERSRASINREIRARQRLITALKKAQALTRRGTIEWKRLRNEIAQEQQAIRDLKKQTADAQKDAASFQQQAFQFLTEQQGFASKEAGNLLGVAIPGQDTGFTTGATTFEPPSTTTTGGGVRPRVPRGADIATSATGVGKVAQAARDLRAGQGRGATTAQMNVLIKVARRTNDLLTDIKAGIGHPEAHKHRIATKHVTETSID